MDSIVVGKKGGRSPADRLWDEAKEIFYEDLGKGKRARLEDTTKLEDTIKSLKLAQDKVSNEYRTHTLRVGSKDIDIKVGRIMRRLELILRVGDAAMQFGPETVSLVWSAFRMVFTGFLNDSQICASLFDAVDQISDILFVCQVYAKRYSEERIATDDSKVAGNQVLKQIPPLYAIVLKFSYQTRKFVTDHGKFGRTLVGVFGGEIEELKKTVDQAKEKRDTLQMTADVAFQAAAIELLEDGFKVFEDVQGAINAVIIPEMGIIQSELTKTRERTEKKDLEKIYRQQRDWLLAGTSAELHVPEKQYLMTLDHRHPGTCRWILRTPQYEAWRDQERPSMLYLLGEGGYGKSFLVSTVIEDLMNNFMQRPSSRPRLVYFFCRSGDNATRYGVKIMLHLVAQLLTAGMDEANDWNDGSTDEDVKYQDLINVVKDARDKIKGSEAKKDSSVLQINSVLQPMFTSLAQVISTRLFVVVDALDECSDLTSGFLDALIALPESGIDIRVLVSSRPEDRISDGLDEVPHVEIEVTKERNYADMLAYIEESLKSMPRFRHLNAGPEIARKSDGMFKYANMVIENLKQSKALRTNVQKLMKRLPDGMNDLYKQKLQKLEEYDREILLIALRWVMCGEGKIEVGLVADDIERCYEDSDYEEDDAQNEDNEESDDYSAVIGVSTDLEAQEESIAYKDRESVKRLRTIGRDFLKFSSAVVDVQHRSVRDFLKGEERSQPRDPRMCTECLKRMNQESTYQASPKHGHLIMVENIFRKLMSPSFQDKFIIVRGVGTNRASSRLPSPSSLTQRSDTQLGDGSTSENAAQPPEPHIRGENPGLEYTVNLDTEATRLTAQAAAKVENNNLPPELLNLDSDKEEPPRYELVQWPRHLRPAEEAWPAAERDADMQERWENLYGTIVRFLSPESLVFKFWSKRLSLWVDKPPDPLHVAAEFGLLGLMQIYISQGTHVDIVDEDGWTPLHLACRPAGHNIGIEFLVEQKADVNALTLAGATPLLIIARNNGPSKKFQYLLDHGAKPEISNEFGYTCLHYAAENRNLDLCKILLRCATVDINAKDRDGDTPLHWLFQFPNASYELVKLFLDRGSNVNEQNEKSQGPLYAACRVGNVAGARLLLDYGADIDDEEIFGKTALHAAVKASNLELVMLLVERRADVHHADKAGRDCFTQAANENVVDILEYLLSNPKSQDSVSQHLFAQDRHGNTPLHLSASRGYDKVVEILLNAGDAAKMCSLTNHDGNNSLHMGAFEGRREVVEALLNNGADPMARNDQDDIPLDSAFLGWKDDYSGGDYAEICERLIRFCSDTKQRADYLDFCVEKGSIELSRALAKAVDSRDVHGWTPKLLAYQYGHREIASILSQKVNQNTFVGSEFTSEAAFVASPSNWSVVATHPRLFISEDGLEVLSPNDSEPSGLLMIARTDHPIKAGLDKYYYEISVLEATLQTPIIGLGFASKYARFDEMPGWRGNGAPTWGYHGDDGKKFACSGRGSQYNETYGPGDTIGCGVNFTDGTIFYTKNGILLPTAFENVRGRLFPVVGMAANGVRLRANFGQQSNVPFLYQP